VILAVLATTALAVWLWLALAHHGFWRAREIDTHSDAPMPEAWPPVAIIVPARDESETIARTIASLVAQDYPGDFRIFLIDDGSSDATAEHARAASAGSDRLHILTGAPLASGWTGKLWAVSQGIAAAGASPEPPRYLLLTDADITHDPANLRRLVARAEARGVVLVSLMARLNCTSFAERALIPAFVFFFQMLYPFARVNRPIGPGAAAGGCMLIRADALESAGGIAAVRGALIDDCAIGDLLKRQGPIWLGLTDRAVSIRRYPHFTDIAAMIARSAYAQLRYSPLLLAGTIAGLAVLYAVPVAAALFGDGLVRWQGIAAWAVMALLFQPMLYFYRRSPLWGMALPLIAAYYTGCTLLSAWQHHRGRGGMWKGRVQAAVGR